MPWTLLTTSRTCVWGVGEGSCTIVQCSLRHPACNLSRVPMKASKLLGYITAYVTMCCQGHPGHTPQVTSMTWWVGVSTACLLPIGRRTTVSTHVASNAMNFDTIHKIAGTLKNLLHFMLWVAQRSMLMPLGRCFIQARRYNSCARYVS
jgi:hypothetical protein